VTLPIVLLGLGLALIVAEIFLPSFGILSILAGASIVAALWFAFEEDTVTGFWFFVCTAALVPITISLAFGVLPKTAFGRKLILSRGGGPAAVPGEAKLDYVGEEGPVETALRPGGFARLRGRRMDVLTRGEFLDVGTRVRVIEVSQNRLIVKEVAGGDPANPEGKPS